MINLEALQKQLIEDEEIRLKPYKCPAGKLTIGVGRNIEENGITKDEALYLLNNDIKRVCVELDLSIAWWRDLSEPRQRVLVNMGFNMGVPRLLKFKKALAAMKDGKWVIAANEMLDSVWAKQVVARQSSRANDDTRSRLIGALPHSARFINLYLTRPARTANYHRDPWRSIRIHRTIRSN
jgi:lysozyme